jgi:hypothetical protein
MRCGVEYRVRLFVRRCASGFLLSFECVPERASTIRVSEEYVCVPGMAVCLHVRLFVCTSVCVYV